jgi:hypothetical protein
MTLVGVPQPGVLIAAVILAVGVPVANDAVARRGGAHQVTNGVPPAREEVTVTAEVRGRSGAWIVVLEAGAIARARGVVRC